MIHVLKYKNVLILETVVQMDDEMKTEQKSWSNTCHDKKSEEDNSKLQFP